MARAIDTEIAIAAPATSVWDVLVGFDHYPEWNPFLVAVEGSPEPGARLRISFSGADGRPFRFRPTIEVFDAPKRLEWRGKAAIRGLFDVHHTFAVSALDARHCRLRNTEEFSGAAVAAVWKFIAGEHTSGLNAMNEALRHRAEAP